MNIGPLRKITPENIKFFSKLILFFFLLICGFCFFLLKKNDKSLKSEDFEYLGSKFYDEIGKIYGIKEYRHKETGIEFVEIPEGSFIMGDNDGNDDEKPEHKVHVRKFLMSKFEITQEVYLKVMDKFPLMPPPYRGAKKPIDYVSWEDAKKFCAKTGMSLPTEAEWEYACRTGYSGKSCCQEGENSLDYAHHSENRIGSGRGPLEVGQKKPNRYGLYDMLGNVFEWCEDEYHEHYQGAPIDGSAWMDSNNPSCRVIRGGSWATLREDTNCTFRLRGQINDSGSGFRVCVRINFAREE